MRRIVNQKIAINDAIWIGREKHAACIPASHAVVDSLHIIAAKDSIDMWIGTAGIGEIVNPAIDNCRVGLWQTPIFKTEEVASAKRALTKNSSIAERGWAKDNAIFDENNNTVGINTKGFPVAVDGALHNSHIGPDNLNLSGY